MLKTIADLGRSLFIFRKPVIKELFVLDLLIENKPLLLIHWVTKNSTSVRIIPLKRRYRMSKGAFILAMPSATDSVAVIARNCWRSTRREVHLTQATLDAEAAELLISEFKPVKHLAITKWFSMQSSTPTYKAPPCKLLLPTPASRKKLSIKPHVLRYP